nr:MAG TPA: hypothetical protein [Caudoviricetes sp.]
MEAVEIRKAVDFNRFFHYNRQQYAGRSLSSCLSGSGSPAAKEF